MSVYVSKTTADRLQKIEILEDKIMIELKEMDEIDFSKKDFKQQIKYYQNYSNYSNLSLKTSKKMNQIYKNFENLFKKIKLFTIPNEKEWEKWNSKDFKRCVFLFNFKKNFVFFSKMDFVI